MLNVSSLSFNGTNQYVKLPTAASIRNLGSFTFVAFFKVGENATDAGKHHAYVERQGTGTGIRFRFTPVQGKLQFGFSPKDGVADTSYTYNTKWDDRWHLASFTGRLGGDNPTYEITLDGVRVADGTLVVPNEVTTISDTAPKGIYMGNHSRLASGESFPSNTAWHGVLDDVAIFNEFVGQGEINTYFSSDDHWEVATKDPEDTEFVAYYTLDALIGSTVTDISRDPVRTGTAYQSGSPSSALWTIDRPFLGDGLIDEEPPTTPVSNPHTNITEDGFDVSWASSMDNVWVQFYELQVSQFANFSTYNAYDMGRKQSMEVRGLLPATNYYWRVRAFDAELNASGYSTVRSLTTKFLGDVTPPEPPTNLTASYVTHSSFRLTFTPSVSDDVVGYKVDVASDDQFGNILSQYRNTNIGNTTVLDIFGLSPLTSFYVRVRSYDAFDNESEDSVYLRVNTPRQPDVTPPLAAVLHEPIGVSSRAATLEWDEGVDDIGVAGYYVDLSTDPTFATYTLANGIYWDTVDVGDSTTYRVLGLEPNTEYFYRVRAYDEAGNIAEHVEEPMSFITQPPSIYESGDVETMHLAESWRSDVVDNPDIITLDGSHDVRFVFALSAVVGSIQHGSLQFMPRPHPSFPTTLGTIEVRATAMNEQDGIATPMEGPTFSANITQLDELMEIDITTLLNSGATAYVVEVSSTGFVGYLDSGTPVDDFNETEASPPMVVIHANPMASTQPLPLDIDVVEHGIINHCKNPSFEIDASPWGSIGSATLTWMFSQHYDGDHSLRIAGTQPNTGGGYSSSYYDQMGETSPGQTHTIALYMKSISGPLQYRLSVQGFNPDIGYISDFTTKTITISTEWEWYYITFTTPEGNITRYAPAVKYNGTATSWSAVIDYVAFLDTDYPMFPFTGDTTNCEWLGDAHTSKSRMPSPTLEIQSSYDGDSNENNSVEAFFKLPEDDEWTPIDAAVQTYRELQQHVVRVPPVMINYNLVPNPAFATNTIWGGGEYDTTRAFTGSRSYRFSGTMTYHDRIPCEPNTTYTLQGRFLSDPEDTVVLGVSMYRAGDVFDNTVLSSGVYSAESWTYETLTFTTGNDIETIAVGAHTEGTASADAIQLNKGAIALPYRDGSFHDAMWQGTPDESSTARMITSETDYEFMFRYYDDDGFFDNTDDKTLDFAGTYHTPPQPDDVFTASELVLDATENRIDVTLNYQGDDNGNATVRFEFRRTDLPTWSEFRPAYDRPRKRIKGSITNLKHGTSYTVRAIITDPDGVYGAPNNIITDVVTTNYITVSVESEPHISFGGFTLMGREDTKIGVTSHNAFGFPNRRVTVEDLPRLDGAVEMQALWGRKEITMDGFISGDSRVDLENVRKSLLAALAPRQQRLVIDTLSHEGRFYNATVESLDIRENADEHVRHLDWTAQFVCADPFAYDIGETTMPTFKAPNNSSISLVNEGDVVTSPQLVLTTTNWFSVTIVIANETTGERMAPKTTILSGDRLIIDSEKRSLTKNGIEVDYAGTFPTLAVGGNTFTFYLSTYWLTPTISVDVRWRHKYL